MRIASSTISENLVRQIQQLGGEQARLQNRVTTNQRITNPSDDAAAAGRVINLESERRALAQFQRNSDRALELSQASYSGLQQIKKVSDRATEVGTLAEGAISADARAAYAGEIDQLIEQAVQLGNSKLRSDYLFAGTATDTAPMAVTRDANGKIASVTYAGNTGESEIAISDSATIKPGTTPDTNAGIADFVNHLVALRDALQSGGGPAIGTARQGLIETEDRFVDALAAQGAVQMRLEVNQTLQRSRTDEVERLVSAEVDDDMASSIVRLNQAQLAYQAALQSSANIMKTSLLDYIR